MNLESGRLNFSWFRFSRGLEFSLQENVLRCICFLCVVSRACSGVVAASLGDAVDRIGPCLSDIAVERPKQQEKILRFSLCNGNARVDVPNHAENAGRANI